MTQVNKDRPRTPKQASRRPSPLDGLLNPDLFKALSDPTRLRLLSCIAKCARACSVGEVAECCAVDLSVVSRHLSLLEAAGALTAKKAGRSVSYEVRYTDLGRSLRALADAIDACRPDTCAPGCACTPGGCCARS